MGALKKSLMERCLVVDAGCFRLRLLASSSCTCQPAQEGVICLGMCDVSHWPAGSLHPSRWLS